MWKAVRNYSAAGNTLYVNNYFLSSWDPTKLSPTAYEYITCMDAATEYPPQQKALMRSSTVATMDYYHIEAETKCPPFSIRHFQWTFLNWNVRISIKISLKFVPRSPVNNIIALNQIMAWHRPGDGLLSKPMMISWLKHICVIRPEWAI